MTDLADLPDWPGALRLEEAALYCNMSVDSFEKCVAAGRFPPAVANLPVRVTIWSRAALDAALAGTRGTADDADAREAAWKRRRAARSEDAGHEDRPPHAR
jgi:predicted DNA-binding transcriptional regulator AlpA